MSDEQESKIRESSASDAGQVREFLNPFFSERRLLERTDEELLKLIQHGFVIERNGEITGFAAIEVYSRKMAEIQCLAVSPNCQGKGFGKRLIQCCVVRARELNIHELMAITSSEKPFTDCGFHYSLPDQKRALFIHPQEEGPP